MADERLNIGIDVDASRLHSEIQRLQLSSQSFVQKQAGSFMNDILSTPAMMAATLGGSAPVRGGNYLDPNIAFKQHMTNHMLTNMVGQSSPFAPGVRGMYGEPLLYPSFTPTDYNYPQGFLRGKPTFMADYHKQSWGKFAHEVGSLAGHVGLHALGIHTPPHGQYRYDQPVYSTFQRESDEFAKAMMKPIGFAESAGRFAGTGLGAYGMVTSATALAGMIPGVGSMVNKLPWWLNPGKTASVGLIGAELGLAELNRGMQVSREYMDIGQYMRDSTAPFLRSNRISGGMSFEQTAQFQERLGRSVGRDMFLSRSDYSDVLKLSNDAGYTQLAGNTQQLNTAVDNIAGNIKALYQLGAKIKNTLETTKILSSVGVDLSADASKNAALLGNISTAAFQAGKPIETIIQNLRSAGQTGLQQNLSMTTGIGAYTSAAGITGELFRSGNLNMSTVALMGGRDNMEQNLMNMFMKVMRTPVGNLSGMMLTQNYLRTGQIRGPSSFNDMVGKMGSLSSPEEYAKMKFLSPFITDEIAKQDPNAMIMNAMNTYIDAYQGAMSPGKQVDPYMMALNLEKQGFTPEEIRTMLVTLKNAPEISKNTAQSTHQQMIRMQLENARKTFGIFNFISKEGRQQLRERWFDPLYADISGGLTRMQGRVSDWHMQKMLNWYAGGTTVYNNDLEVGDKIRNITDQMIGGVDMVQAQRDLRTMGHQEYLERLGVSTTPAQRGVTAFGSPGAIGVGTSMLYQAAEMGGDLAKIPKISELLGRVIPKATEGTSILGHGIRYGARAGVFGVGLAESGLRAVLGIGAKFAGYPLAILDAAQTGVSVGRALKSRSAGFTEKTMLGFGENRTVMSELLQKTQGEMDEKQIREGAGIGDYMFRFSGLSSHKDILKDEEALQNLAEQAAQLESVYKTIAPQLSVTRSKDSAEAAMQSAKELLGIGSSKFARDNDPKQTRAYAKIFHGTRDYANFLVSGSRERGALNPLYKKMDYNTLEALAPTARLLFSRLANSRDISDEDRDRYRNLVQKSRTLSDEKFLASLSPEDLKVLSHSLQGTDLAKNIKGINVGAGSLNVMKELDKRLDPIKKLIGKENVSAEDLDKYYKISYQDTTDQNIRDQITSSYKQITGKNFDVDSIYVSPEDQNRIKSGISGIFSKGFTSPNMTKREFDALTAGKSYALDIQFADQFRKILDKTDLKDGAKGSLSSAKGNIVGLIDKIMGGENVSQSDLKAGFKSMSGLKDKNLQDLGDIGTTMLSYIGDTSNQNLRKDFELKLKGFLSPHYKDADELNKKVSELSGLAQQGNQAPLVSGLMAYAGASSMSSNTYLAGGKAEGYITPEMMREFATGVQTQQNAADRLLEVADKIDFSKLEFGMFGGKEKMQTIAKEIGTAIGDTLLKDPKFIKVVTSN